MNLMGLNLDLLRQSIIAHLLMPTPIPIHAQNSSIFLICRKAAVMLSKIIAKSLAYVVVLIVIFEILYEYL